MIIKNLAAVITGEGFRSKSGRRPSAEDVGLRQGPLDLHIDTGGGISELQPSDASPGDFDGSGLVATAGWIDSHTHTFFAGNRAAEYFQRWRGASYKEISDGGGGIHNSCRDLAAREPEKLLNDFLSRLDRARAHGITTLEVKSGYADTAGGELRVLRLIKEARALSALSGPDIHPTFLGLHSLPKARNEREFVDEMIAVLPIIAQEKLALSVDAFPEIGFFSLEESERYAKVARANGLSLKIHADELSPLGSAETFARLDALSVDHLQRIGNLGIEALATRDTVACLLPATSFYLDLPYTDARRLLQAGARVALATDFNPGTAPWPDFRQTCLLAATQFKMTPAEILCALTFNAAASLGRTDRGTLTPGQRADLSLWKIDGLVKNGLEEILLSPQPPQRVLVNGRLN